MEELRQYRGNYYIKAQREPVSWAQRRGKPRSVPPHAGRRVPNGQHVLRAKIDLSSQNMNLRDPPLYRIRHNAAPPHGDGLADLPHVRLCASAERRVRGHHPLDLHAGFEAHRPLYDFRCIHELADTPAGQKHFRSRPQQIEFARLA